LKIRHIAGAALLALVALSPQASAQTDRTGKLRIFANGLWSVSKIDFDGTRAYTEFGETSSVVSQYTIDAGFGFEGGVRYDFAKHIGAAASFTSRSGDAAATFSTGLPHPLFFDRKREVTGEVDNLAYKERAEHVGLVLSTSTGRWDLAAVVGAAFFQVEGETIDLVQYQHAYPYDTATVTGVTRFAAKDSPIGFSIGATVDYRVHQHVALGAMARFASATAKFEQADQSSAEVKLGGLQVGAGLRLIF
jgi:Outer membrane protein beta-barrel domain